MLALEALYAQPALIQVKHVVSLRGQVQNAVRLAADGCGRILVADAFERRVNF